MELMIPRGRLDRAVDHEKDHVFGPTSEIILVEYGSYACSHIMTWMWFQPSRHHRFRLSYPAVEDTSNAGVSWRTVAFEGG